MYILSIGKQKSPDTLTNSAAPSKGFIEKNNTIWNLFNPLNPNFKKK